MDRTVPHPPVPVAPVHGAPVRGDIAKLVWEPYEGATGYRVQVAPDADFQQLIVDTRLEGVTSLVVRSVLHGGSGSVFWRVAALGPGGQGAFCEAAEFHSSAAPAEAPHAGLTAEAGAETGRQGTQHDPAPTRSRRTGSAEFGAIIAVLFITLLAITIAFMYVPSFQADDDASQQERGTAAPQQTSQQIDRYSADSAGYAIPIDSAINRMAQPAGLPVAQDRGRN